MSAVTQWVAEYKFEEIKERCDKAGCPVSAIYSMKDIFEDPQYAARHDIVEMPCEEFGSVKMPAVCPILTETPGEIKWTGPKLGSYNEEIYGELLGKSETELERLRAEGTI